MEFKVQQTEDAVEDITHMAAYMIEVLHNHRAAMNFIEDYDKQINMIQAFPHSCRGTPYQYRGYEIKRRTFRTYLIFYIVDNSEHLITILRVLKTKQNYNHLFL